MVEEGRVVELFGDVARVELEASSACSDCSMAGLCHLTREGVRTIEAEVVSGVQVGSRVRVEMQKGQLLRGSILLFVIPAFAFVIGAGVGQAVASSIAVPVAMGFGFLGATYLALHLLDRRIARKYKHARVVEVCS